MRWVCGKPCNSRIGGPEPDQRAKIWVSSVRISAVSKSSIEQGPMKAGLQRPWLNRLRPWSVRNMVPRLVRGDEAVGPQAVGDLDRIGGRSPGGCLAQRLKGFPLFVIQLDFLGHGNFLPCSGSVARQRLLHLLQKCSCQQTRIGLKIQLRMWPRAKRAYRIRAGPADRACVRRDSCSAQARRCRRAFGRRPPAHAARRLACHCRPEQHPLEAAVETAVAQRVGHQRAMRCGDAVQHLVRGRFGAPEVDVLELLYRCRGDEARRIGADRRNEGQRQRQRAGPGSTACS